MATAARDGVAVLCCTAVEFCSPSVGHRGRVTVSGTIGDKDKPRSPDITHT